MWTLLTLLVIGHPAQATESGPPEADVRPEGKVGLGMAWSTDSNTIAPSTGLVRIQFDKLAIEPSLSVMAINTYGESVSTFVAAALARPTLAERSRTKFEGLLGLGLAAGTSSLLGADVLGPEEADFAVLLQWGLGGTYFVSRNWAVSVDLMAPVAIVSNDVGIFGLNLIPGARFSVLLFP